MKITWKTSRVKKSESPDLLCKSASGALQAEVIRRPGTVRKTCRAALAYAAGGVERALAGALDACVCPSGLLAGTDHVSGTGRYIKQPVEAEDGISC